LDMIWSRGCIKSCSCQAFVVSLCKRNHCNQPRMSRSNRCTQKKLCHSCMFHMWDMHIFSLKDRLPRVHRCWALFAILCTKRCSALSHTCINRLRSFLVQLQSSGTEWTKNVGSCAHIPAVAYWESRVAVRMPFPHATHMQNRFLCCSTLCTDWRSGMYICLCVVQAFVCWCCAYALASVVHTSDDPDENSGLNNFRVR
jgi:hypothetical protein